MLIKLLYGTYGAKEGDVIVSKTNKSDPFEVEEKRGRRLIDMGYAVQIDAGYPEREDSNAEEGEKEDVPQKETVKSLREYSLEDLKKQAKAMGLSTKGSKQQILERIQAEQDKNKPVEENRDEESGDDSKEEPPVLTPAEPEV